jgi:hypothetical protein
MLAMCWVMMIAMMVPSAASMILLYARVARHEQKSGRLAEGVVPTAAFAIGYLIAWLVFSVLASVLQFSLERAGLVHSMLMWSLNSWLSAGMLFAVGLYQIYAVQTDLSQALSLTGAFSLLSLAFRTFRRDLDGDRARRILRRLLLGPDGAAFRRRHHELALDRWPNSLCAGGESCAAGRVGCARSGARLYRGGPHTAGTG